LLQLHYSTHDDDTASSFSNTDWEWDWNGRELLETTDVVYPRRVAGRI
jgi:hypothetical protein